LYIIFVTHRKQTPTEIGWRHPNTQKLFPRASLAEMKNVCPRCHCTEETWRIAEGHHRSTIKLMADVHAKHKPKMLSFLDTGQQALGRVMVIIMSRASNPNVSSAGLQDE
uniref:Uncharacterized protein n=1 Tax=Cynoglossus semilaevis TaxID=244447 RepID=A0A3P8V721_CYNSE